MAALRATVIGLNRASGHDDAASGRTPVPGARLHQPAAAELIDPGPVPCHLPRHAPSRYDQPQLSILPFPAQEGGLGGSVNIAVVALGKIGLPVAAWYAVRGHHVTGCDIDAAVVAAVNRGHNPIGHEPGLTDQVRTAVTAGRLRATTDTAAAVAAAEVVVVLVPLDVDAARRPDFAALDAAFSAVATGMQPSTLILLETTVPVGTCRGRYLPVLEAGGHRCGQDFFFAFSPERVQSGRIARDLAAYPRVVGGIDDTSAARAAAFYAETHHVPVIPVSSAEAAEFCKLAESIERDVNIALANELAAYAADHGVDFFEVRTAAASQPQSHLLRPGLGVGGHCIPVYPYFLTHDAARAGLTLAARALNDAMPRRAAELLAGALDGLIGRRIVILGLTYRPGVKELRHSPALALAAELRRQGASVLGHDPLLSGDEIASLSLTAAAPDGSAAVDALVLHTADPAYVTLDVRRMSGLRVVLDCAGALDGRAIAEAGIAYLAIGRPTHTPAPAKVAR
jgi:nucleotide sugar dehydrogenase